MIPTDIPAAARSRSPASRNTISAARRAPPGPPPGPGEAPAGVVSSAPPTTSSSRPSAAPRRPGLRRSPPREDRPARPWLRPRRGAAIARPSPASAAVSGSSCSVPSMLTRGSRRSSHGGIRQVRSPSRCSVAGSSRHRITSASRNTAVARLSAELLDHAVFAEHEREEHADHDRRGGGDDATGQRQPLADRAGAVARHGSSVRGCARRGTPRSPSRGRRRSRTASPG